jgi:hypothetical protein
MEVKIPQTATMDMTLHRLYSQWLILQMWLKDIQQYGKAAVYEIVAIRERHSVTALCYHGSAWLDVEDFSKLQGEIVSCRKIDRKHHAQIIAGIIGNLWAMREAHPFQGVVPIEKGTYAYGAFKPTLSQEVTKYLAAFDIETALALLLRYECLCPQGQQWAVPKQWINRICQSYGLDIIAFSSPLNKQFDNSAAQADLKVEGTSNIQYYSGFAEDKAFGSQGSFFDVQPDFLDKFAGKRCTIEANPPFIERILLDAAIKFDELFKYAAKMKNPPHLTVLFITPDWTDAEYFKQTKGLSCEYSRAIQLYPGEHGYENATGGVSIVARQRSWLFILSNVQIQTLPLQGFKTTKTQDKRK